MRYMDTDTVIVHLATHWDEVLCGKHAYKTSDIPGLEQLEGDDVVCRDCENLILEIVARLYKKRPLSDRIAATLRFWV